MNNMDIMDGYLTVFLYLSKYFLFATYLNTNFTGT